jgi:tRNA (mo5U34)-methyltransferase
MTDVTDDIRGRVDAIEWYHTLELAPGIETDGVFDLRPFVARYHLPERMDGLRVLDVGTWDGFWAFEFERRGAAEVHGLDIDDLADLDYPPRRRPAEVPSEPRGTGFRLAKDIYGSRAERIVCNLYDARPEDLGQYDIVFAGSILLHVRDQLLALERIAALVKPGGLFISAEEYDLAASLIPRIELSRYRANRDSAVVFWLPAIRTWRSMLWTAGFDRVEQKSRFKLRSRRDYSVRHVVFHARR